MICTHFVLFVLHKQQSVVLSLSDITINFNKVKKSYEGNGIHYFQREVAKKYSKNIIMNSKSTLLPSYFCNCTTLRVRYKNIF